MTVMFKHLEQSEMAATERSYAARSSRLDSRHSSRTTKTLSPLSMLVVNLDAMWAQAQQQEFSVTFALQSRQGAAMQYNATQQLEDIAVILSLPGTTLLVFTSPTVSPAAASCGV